MYNYPSFLSLYAVVSMGRHAGIMHKTILMSPFHRQTTIYDLMYNVIGLHYLQSLSSFGATEANNINVWGVMSLRA
jgi:hypothetical protein